MATLSCCALTLRNTTLNAKGILLQYQKFSIKIYHRISDKEAMAHNLKKAVPDTTKAETDNTAEAEGPQPLAFRN